MFKIKSWRYKLFVAILSMAISGMGQYYVWFLSSYLASYPARMRLFTTNGDLIGY